MSGIFHLFLEYNHIETITSSKSLAINLADCQHKLLKPIHLQVTMRFKVRVKIVLPALAGIVQGVVVHMAKHISGKNSSNKPFEAGGGLTILKIAYMLLDTCPSGY